MFKALRAAVAFVLLLASSVLGQQCATTRLTDATIKQWLADGKRFGFTTPQGFTACQTIMGKSSEFCKLTQPVDPGFDPTKKIFQFPTPTSAVSPDNAPSPPGCQQAVQLQAAFNNLSLQALEYAGESGLMCFVEPAMCGIAAYFSYEGWYYANQANLMVPSVAYFCGGGH